MAEIEITLLLLLILIGLLNAKPPYPRLSIVLLTIGVLLAFLPPVASIDVPWDIVIGLTIPVILWQNSRRLFLAHWISNTFGIVLFLITIACYSALVFLSDNFLWYGSTLFGIIAAGIIWRAGELETDSSYLSQLGPLILIFLLVEIDPALNNPNRYFGSMVNGAAIGLIIALISANLAKRVSNSQRDWLAIGQIYLAFWLAYLVGFSPLSSSVTNLIFFVALGFQNSLWEENQISPAPLNSQIFFILILLLFLFVGWQTHQELSTNLIVEVVIGCIVGLIIVWIGIRLKLPSFRTLQTPWSTGIRVMVFLLPALLLWPRGALNQPELLFIAVLATGLLLALSTRLMTHFYQTGKSNQ